jgi:hypothetical protein
MMAAGVAPPGAVSPSRQQFIDAVDTAFGGAGISYALLHGYERSIVDSDLDVVVSREHIAAVDLLIRSNAIGRLLQVIPYDIPWCRYYVVATGDADRPYRQLDVSSDPWGLSMLGRSLAAALESASGGRPTRAAETFLLLAKRAHKGLRRPGDANVLVDAFAADPAGASRLLGAELGDAGIDAASDLADGTASPRMLQEVSRAIDRRRRTPTRLMLRALFSVGRIARRIARPTGLVVVIAGPDGVGKSTLADDLPAAADGLFWSSTRLHLAPQLLPPPGRLLRRLPADATLPHGRTPSRRFPSFLRLAYLWLDTLVAWGPKVALVKRRSSLVLIERGWRDLEIDPRRYRIDLPQRLVATFAHAQPHPDLVLVLDVPAEIAVRRKPELPAAEVKRQLQQWRARADADPTRHVVIDATRDRQAVVAEALAAIEARLAERQRGIGRLGLVFRILGGVRPGGRPHAIVSTRRGARWVVPARIGGVGPVGRGLYRPFRGRHILGSGALELVHRAGGVGLRRVPLAVERGLGPELAHRLSLSGTELAAVVTSDPTRGQRAVLSVCSDGRVVAFAKVAVEEGGLLLREAGVLDALARASPERIVASRVLDCFTWFDTTVLLVEPLSARGPVDRNLTDVELAALDELRQLGPQLAAVLGDGEGLVPIHGDFAPWNCSVLDGGRLALWDWEEARLGLPQEDVFNWEVARCLRGTGRPMQAIVADALASGRIDAFRRHLDLTLGMPPRSLYPGVAEFRRNALALLEADA